MARGPQQVGQTAVSSPRGFSPPPPSPRSSPSSSSPSSDAAPENDDDEEVECGAMPRTARRGRYSALLASARDECDAAEKRLAAQEEAVAAAEAAVLRATALAEAHANAAGGPHAAGFAQVLTGPAAARFAFRRLGSAVSPPHDGRHLAATRRRVNTSGAAGFRPTNTLEQSRRNASLARERIDLEASTAAVRRSDYGVQLRARAELLAAAAEEAKRARDAAALEARRAADALAEALRVPLDDGLNDRRRSATNAAPSGRPAEPCRLLARRVPFSESNVRLSRRAAKDRHPGAAEDQVAHVTAAHRLHVGLLLHRCRRCRARFWDGEKHKQDNHTRGVEYTACCRRGDVDLDARQAFPEPLMSLVRGDTPASKAFLDKFRSYQSAFQAASTGISNKTMAGPYSAFTVQGRLYHTLATAATPEEGKKETFMQIYTLDDQAAAVRRGELFQGLDADALSQLTRMMTEHNPYVQQFKALGDASTPTATLILRTPEGRTVNGNDARTYRAPTASEVAVLILGDEDGQRRGREVIVHKVQGDHADGYAVQRIPTTDAAFMPLHFMLLCPRGEPGWSTNLYRASDSGPPEVEEGEIIAGSRRGKRKRITPQKRAAFYLAVRGDNTHEENPLHCCRRGFGEWCCESFALQEERKLSYLATNDMQRKLRRTSFDHISTGNASVGEQVGQRVLLPASHTGSWRNMYGRYCDAMALVRRYGKPSFFITFTCNSEWPEIRAELLPGQEPKDRPDLVARVFNLKLQELMRDLTVDNVLGEVMAHTYVIEYQKRGLPHAHILLLMAPGDVPSTPEQMDACVSAELPDKDAHPSLHKTVIKSMIHGPCGALNPNCSCMVDGKCSKGFPRAFADETTTGAMAKVMYRRRDDGRTTEIRGVSMDNRWVVPYNPYLCTKYDAHINVEIATSVQSVKYLYKYIYKGHDRALWEVRGDAQNGTQEVRNEIQEFQDGRYIGACEAVWRTFGFSTGEIHPPVERLDLHLPGEETVYVAADEDLGQRRLDGPPKTSLTAYFDYVRDHPEDALAQTLRYVDFPEHYVWHGVQKRWTRRKTRQFRVARLFTAGIRDMERYCLRMLLHNVRGATSFESLRTVEGVTHATFKAAALALGLLADDAEWDNALQEASDYFMAPRIRELFAVILEFEVITDPMALWEKHKAAMSEDFLRNAERRHGVALDPSAAENLCLNELHHLLAHLDKDLEDFGLPPVDFGLLGAAGESRAMAQERAYDRTMQAGVVAAKTALMNSAQRAAYDEVRAALDAARAGNDFGHRFFFLNGPAGTGKTFVYDTLLASVRQEGRIALATAASGIAALLLPGGTTAHGRFKIPVRGLDHKSFCKLPKTVPPSAAVEVIVAADLILIDEAPMMHKHCFGAMDRTLRDHTGVDKPFGGKVVVIGGDFRQCLPVVKRGQPADCVDACLKRWDQWGFFKLLKLTENVRVRNAMATGGSSAEALRDYDAWLQHLGDGTLQTYPREGEEEHESDSAVRIPDDMVLPEETQIEELIKIAYGDDVETFSSTDPEFLASRSILSPRNKNVDEVNLAALKAFPLGVGTVVSPAERTYYSADSVKEVTEDGGCGAAAAAPRRRGMNDQDMYMVEYLNTINGGTLPQHKLELKKGCIVMLLRNLNPREGLANGTRVVVKNMYNHLVEVQIVGGPHNGKVALIPRITNSCDDDLPFTLHRRQFPLKLAFAMTINKAQGQTLKNVVLYLPFPVFAHGQLYTAFSRVGDPSKLKALIHRGRRGDGFTYTSNVVYRQVTCDDEVSRTAAPQQQRESDG